MLGNYERSQVDNLGVVLNQEMIKIANSGEWGGDFIYEHASNSNYSGGRLGTRLYPRRGKWCQINDSTYGQESYASEGEDGTSHHWKLQARFRYSPHSGLWIKKKSYIYNRKPREWSLGGDDVWGMSYEMVWEALQRFGQKKLLEIVLADLKLSWKKAA